MNRYRTDRLLLQAVRIIRRRYPWLARRLQLLRRTGLGADGNSLRWARQGLMATRVMDNPYWLILDMGHPAQRMLYICGRYAEGHISRYMENTLQPGDVFIDIGANIGVYTLLAAHLVGTQGRCIAVEPNPHSHAVLQGHVGVNRIRNVTVVCAALSAKEGTLPMHAAGGENLSANLRPEAAATPTDIQVMTQTGDSIFCDVPVNVKGLCKIDTEGYELEVIKGMPNFIREHQHVHYIVEVTERWLRTCGGTADELFGVFAEEGYSPHLIHPGGLLERINGPRSESFQYDVVFKRVHDTPAILEQHNRSAAEMTHA